MTDTYPLGSIPALTAWEVETLTFNVTSSLGAGTLFSKRATPCPKGKMSIDEKTGVFTYTRAVKDKDEGLDGQKAGDVREACPPARRVYKGFGLY